MRPAGADTRRMMLSALTDLPQPDSPTSATVSPARTSHETPSTARTTPPEVLNCVWRFLTSRRTSPACSMPGQSSTRAGEVFGSRAGDVAFSRPAISRPRSSGGAAAGHAHLGEDLPDGVENTTHLALAEATDAPDAEAVGDGELAGIDDVATAREAIIEALEVERGIAGHAHGDDDGRLDRVGEEGLEAQGAETLYEDAAVRGVAGTAPCRAALRGVLGKRLVERGQHVGRRGETPLARLLHAHPLIVQVEGERVRVAAGGLQRGLTDDGEADSGYAFETLVRRGDQRVVRHAAGVEGQGTEGAHGVHEEAAAVAGGDGGDLLHRIQHARGRLALNHRHVRDSGIGGERGVEGGRGHRRVLGGLDRHTGAREVLT